MTASPRTWALRALAAHGNVEVSEVIREDNRIADRHEVTVAKRDGTTSRIEVYLFGELSSDGRPGYAGEDLEFPVATQARPGVHLPSR
ncbi:MAG TPA: hypothetical protein VLW50_27245 [Streptosporangiaceae bacterium]|nr:hypothetical protein [Streptosporangiaceae bacterium]